MWSSKNVEGLVERLYGAGVWCIACIVESSSSEI